jgi:hypothetical protein
MIKLIFVATSVSAGMITEEEIKIVEGCETLKVSFVNIRHV